VRVRGPVKVAAHLAFGLVVIAAEQMLRLQAGTTRGSASASYGVKKASLI